MYHVLVNKADVEKLQNELDKSSVLDEVSYSKEDKLVLMKALEAMNELITCLDENYGN